MTDNSPAETETWEKRQGNIEGTPVWWIGTEIACFTEADADAILDARALLREVWDDYGHVFRRDDGSLDDTGRRIAALLAPTPTEGRGS